MLPEYVALNPKTVLELIKEFASTWLSIDAYDKEILTPVGTTKKSIKLDGLELVEVIKNFKFDSGTLCVLKYCGHKLLSKIFHNLKFYVSTRESYRIFTPFTF